MGLKKNTFWRKRTRHGRLPIFETPEMLMKVAIEYFSAVDANPIYKAERYGNEVVQVPINRPYSLKAFCLFISVNSQYFTDFEKSLNKLNKDKANDFSLVIKNIKETIETQQLEGATVNIFNHNIVSRLLGLTDKSEMKVTSREKLENMSDQDLDEVVEIILNRTNGTDES